MSKCALPANGAAIRIEQYCKRRKDRMKPKWQEASSCVFAYSFCRGTCQRRDTAEKRKSAEIASAQIRKKLCKKPLGRYGRKIVKGEASFRPVCRSQSAAPVIRGIAHPRSVAGRITGHRRSLPQPSSAAWCPPPLYRSRAYLPHVAAY